MASALHILELEIEISLRRQRVFRDRLNPLEQYSDREFITRYKITRYMFIEILDQISSKVIDQLFAPILFLQQHNWQ